MAHKAFHDDDDDGGYVIHGKNLIAEVSVTAHSDLVTFFTHQGLSVSSEHIAHEDAVRVRISGRPETVDESVDRFLEQNPEVPLHILGTVADEDESKSEGSEPA
ncbi:MAG TPA: hypothetical protein VFU65_12570 [Actinocrinis sp.]|nr:hypothetical protein [Actinocrinis sp.]